MMNENWQSAKILLDNSFEPNINFGDDKKHLDVYRPSIREFPCQYIKHRTKKGIKSWLVIFNGEQNSCYVKNFNEIEKDDNTF